MAALPTASISLSRPQLLERTLLFTLSCSLIADYCGGNLPCTDAWAFFTLLSLYLAAAQHRPIVISFIFGCITLFADILFLAIVKRGSAATTFSAFEYLGKCASVYLLYYYLRSDLGGILTLAGEPNALPPVAAGQESYQYKDTAAGFAASDGSAADAGSAPYSGSYPTGGYNSSPVKGPSGGGYQSSL